MEEGHMATITTAPESWRLNANGLPRRIMRGELTREQREAVSDEIADRLESAARHGQRS
jgi:hypothetical protein